MSNTRIIDMQIKQIIKLKQEGYSLRRIAKELNVHRKTVKSYLAHYNQSGVEAEQAIRAKTDIINELDIGIKEKEKNERFKRLEAFLLSQKGNKSKPGFTIQNMYKDYESLCSNECYSRAQFYKQVRSIWNTPKGSIGLTHKYGEKMMVDYTGKKLSYVDKATGEVKQAEVLVVILPASQYIYLEAMDSQQKEPFMNGIMNALEYFGGVPKGIVTDNLKSAVTKVGKYQSVINQSLQEMALHYETVIDPTRPYRPKDKALVEGAVKICYQSIFYEIGKYTHFSIANLNASILIKLKELNSRKLSNSDHSRKDKYEAEKSYLGPLAKGRYSIKEYRKAKVQKMGYVLCGSYKNYYSVPYRYIGKEVKLRYDHTTLEVFYKSERIAMHKTSQAKGQYVTIASHLSSNNQACIEWSPEYFSKRASIHGIGVQQYVDALISQRSYPEQAYKQVQGIIALCKEYTSIRVNEACKIAKTHPKYSYNMIKSILVNNCDQHRQAGIDTKINKIPPHDNIRGAENFT